MSHLAVTRRAADSRRLLLSFLFLLTFLAVAATAHAAGGTLIGKTLTRIPGGDNFLNRAVVQGDGRIVVAGGARFGTLQYQITRYNTDGSLDTTFANNGTILEPLGPGNGQAWRIGLQSDGKIIVAGDVRSDRDKFGIARFNTDGTLDLTFGGGGSAVSIGPGDAGAYAMAIQSDGKIILGGYSMTAATGGKKVFTLARYNTNDTIDTTFGTNGFAIAPAGTNDEVIKAIGIQSNGSIVAAGTIGGGGVRLMRFTSAGAIDGTWATGSVSYMLSAQDLVVQSNDAVAILGNVDGGSVSEVGVLRMTAAGAVDTTFGNGNCAFGACPGIAHTSISDSATGYGLAIQSGNYVVSGDTFRPAGQGSAVALTRFTSTGAVDTTFGTNGIVVSQPTGSGDAGRGLALRGDGRIIVAGLANGSFGDYDAMTIAFTANGAIDNTFNTTGYSKIDVGSMSGEWRAEALQPDGKIVAAGFTIPEAHVGTAVKKGVVARYLSNGTLDTTFGTGGITQFAWPANAVALQGDGRIVVGGYSLTGSAPAKPSMTFGRFNADGTVDNTFGTSGTFAIAPASADEEINAIALQSDGGIVGAGFVTGTFLDSVLVRVTTNGALDTTFNGSGKLVASTSTGGDVLTAVGIQGDGKIVGAGWAEVSGSQDSMTAVRATTTGTLDAAFGTGGIATINFGSEISNAYAMLIQPDGNIVLGGKVFNTSNSTDDFAIARLLPSGALDTSFGTNGLMSNDFGNHNRIFGLTRLPSGKLLGAGLTGGFFSLVQYTSAGTLDISFGTNGSADTQINAGNDYANAVLLGADNSIVTVGNGSGMLALARFTSDVASPADLAISQGANPNPAIAGQDVTFTLTITNNGSGSASGVTVTDTIPAGTTFVSATTGCSSASGTVTCSIGGLASGASSSVQITVTPTTSGSITNNASVSAVEPDPNSANNSTSLAVTVNAAAQNPLLGLSTRMQVLTGDNVLIGGFVIGGSTPKTVIIRARGPSLTQQGVAGAMADPTLTLVPASGPSTTNDDWGQAPNAAQIQASGLAPSDPKESAIMVTLQPGPYTAIVSGVGGTTGVALVEIYEVDHPEVPMTAISTRGKVQTGDGVMIGGFIIGGSTPRTVVVRARGPSLTQQGVAGALSDPTLTLVPAAGGPTITNDDWGTAANASSLQASGYAPSDPKESAILITLNPGAYTAVVSGVGGATGVGIVEVFDLQ